MQRLGYTGCTLQTRLWFHLQGYRRIVCGCFAWLPKYYRQIKPAAPSVLQRYVNWNTDAVSQRFFFFFLSRHCVENALHWIDAVRPKIKIKWSCLVAPLFLVLFIHRFAVDFKSNHWQSDDDAVYFRRQRWCSKQNTGSASPMSPVLLSCTKENRELGTVPLRISRWITG